METGQNIIVDMDMTDNLKALRKNSGMSQSVVAARLQTMGIKMSRSWLSAIELGRRNLPLKVLVGLKLIYRCNYEDFFTGLEKQMADCK